MNYANKCQTIRDLYPDIHNPIFRFPRQHHQSDGVNYQTCKFKPACPGKKQKDMSEAKVLDSQDPKNSETDKEVMGKNKPSIGATLAKDESKSPKTCWCCKYAQYATSNKKN